MALNHKQNKFWKEYTKDLNATQAALRAGYSKKTAYSQGNRLLKHAEVKKKIKEFLSKRAETTEAEGTEVIAELSRLGFSNIQDYISAGNEIKDISKISREKAASVKSIKKTLTEWGSGPTAGTKTTVTIELYDKISALEKLGKHLGIFELDNKQKSNVILVTVEDE